MFKLVCIVLFFIVNLGGCFSKNWKEAKQFYGTYINKPACIDYSDKGLLDHGERIFAIRMMGIDIQLESLLRYLQNNDRPPSDKSIYELLKNFPWLSGVALLESDGSILAQEPEGYLKGYDFSGILQAKPRSDLLQSIRGYVQNTFVGPQVFVAIPVYVDSEMKGLFVVYFDMAKLASYSPYNRDIIIFSPGTVLWSGQFSFEETPMYKENWSTIIQNIVSGKLSNKNGKFLWLNRFIGGQSIIFSTPVSGSFFERTKECSIEHEFINIVVIDDGKNVDIDISIEEK